MARSLNGSNQRLATATTLPSGSFTLSLWVNPTALPTSGNLMCLMNSYDYLPTPDDTFGIDFALHNNSGTQRVYCGIGITDGVRTATVNTTLSTAAWSWLGVVNENNSSLKIYNSSGEIATVSYTGNYAAGSKALHLGAFGFYTASGSDLGRYFNGAIAEVAYYTAALNPDELTQLYGGRFSPALLRPDALAAYWPLVDSDGDADRWGQYNLSATNSPTYAAHPPIIYRTRPRVVLSPRTYYAGGSPAIGGAAIGANPIGGSSQVGTASAPPSTPSIVGTIFRSPIIRAAS